MFESGYLTLFGKEFGEDRSQARQAAQKALVLNALENFKEFDKIFPALVAGLPIHVFKSAYSAREVSWCLLHTVILQDVKIFSYKEHEKQKLMILFVLHFFTSRTWQRP